MLFSLLKRSFSNQKKAMAVMALSVAAGTAVTASLITVSLDIKGKVSKELRAFGANIVLEPKVTGLADIAGQRRYLREEDVVKSKTIFWRHNIVGVAPFLEERAGAGFKGKSKDITLVGTWFEKRISLPGEKADFEAGVRSVSPWWSLTGSPPEGKTVALGVSLARELGAAEGDEVLIDGSPYVVSGTLSTGGREDWQAFMELGEAQALKGREGDLTRVLVSALTTPMDDFAYKNPDTMSRLEYEKWYCTGYVTSIAKQLEEVFAGSKARPIWHVAETEGNVLGRLGMLIYLMTAAALLTSALAVSSTMAAGVLRRLDEIALMKSIGADAFGISLIFLSEAFVIGLAGGAVGYLASLLAAKFIGLQVFGSVPGARELLLPLSLLSALVISAFGSVMPIRRALRVKPALVLKGAR